MASITPRPVSLLVRLKVFWLVLNAVRYSLVNLVLGRGVKSKSGEKRFRYALIRYLLDHSTGESDYALGFPGTEGRYLKYCEKKSFQPDTVVLDHGAKAHWLGPRDAERYIVWFHGGGFAVAGDVGHFAWLQKWSQTLSKQKSTSAVMLNYTLTADAKYPTQIKQVVSLLNYLLKQCGLRPDQLVIGGDSAGGNLTMAVLSHILHPHPQIPERIELSGPLAGALLVSPWVNFSTMDALFKSNLENDIIGEHVGMRWGPAYRGEHTDNYIEAQFAETEWFHGLERAVSNIWVWAGGAEVLVGSINEMTKKLREVHPRVDYFVEEDGIHINFFLDANMNPPEENASTRKIEQWISSV